MSSNYWLIQYSTIEGGPYRYVYVEDLKNIDQQMLKQGAVMYRIFKPLNSTTRRLTAEWYDSDV